MYLQTVRNLGDGISLADIADSALDSLSNIVLRLSELSQQAGSGTLGQTQRKSLDTEAQALREEYYRIVNTTKFNGVGLLNGELDVLSLKAGSGTIDLKLPNLLGEAGEKTVEFEDPVSMGVGNDGFGPITVHVGDFNGDGALDILTNNLDGTMDVLFGAGDGTFAPSHSFSVMGFPTAVSVTDVNGDGVLDLVTAGSGHLGVLLGAGDGTFALATSSYIGFTPGDISMADLDGDGHQDIVVAASFSSDVYVYMGHGNGSFNFAGATYSVGSDPSVVEIGDFNGDGIPDIVTADRTSGTLSILLGNGDGSFQARTSIELGTLPSVAIGDFNGDGIQDLIAMEPNESTASVFLGMGDGTFGAPLSFEFDGLHELIRVGDFNNDGIDDFLTTNTFDSHAYLMLGKGDGTFSERTPVDIANRGNDMAIADLNGDGVLDFVSVGTWTGSVNVVLGASQGGGTKLPNFSLLTQAGALSASTLFKQTLAMLTEQRGVIGAFQSRVQFAVNHLVATSVNTREAESRIRDADIAAEAADLVRLSILRDSAAAVLAQANQQPALILDLLPQVGAS